MSVPRTCAEIVEYWESFRAAPYLCPSGIPTIGYGTTRYPGGRPVALRDADITREYAEEIMLVEIEVCFAAVDRLCPELGENRRAALASFTYNLGAGRLRASTLREYVNEKNYNAAAEEFGKWVWAKGRRLAGLVARRAQEAELFLTPDPA